jgi:hypothetical protein
MLYAHDSRLDKSNNYELCDSDIYVIYTLLTMSLSYPGPFHISQTSYSFPAPGVSAMRYTNFFALTLFSKSLVHSASPHTDVPSAFPLLTIYQCIGKTHTQTLHLS